MRFLRGLNSPHQAEHTTRQRDEVRHNKWKSCLNFCHDSSTNKYCSRTLNEWAAIIFYTVMFLMFVVTFLMILLYITMVIIKHNNKPNIYKKYLPKSSGTGKIGISVVPMVYLSYPLISYNSKTKDYEKYTDEISLLLSEYEVNNQIDCSDNNSTLDKMSVCKFDLTSLGACSVSPYGYDVDQPCFFVKINKEVGWSEETLTPENSLSDVPGDVKRMVTASRTQKYWLHCSGYYSSDKQHIGEITYYPTMSGFDTKYFPYKHNVNYHTPLVAVQLKRFDYDVSIVLQCGVWYREGRNSTTDFIFYVAKHQVS